MALVNRKWLTDNVINAAQTLLKRAYPNIGGLQDTALAEILAFDVQREFIQVLNLSGCHWITVSNIGCKSGFVNVYDSCYVSLRTKEQLQQCCSVKTTNSSWSTKQFNLSGAAMIVDYSHWHLPHRCVLGRIQ